MKLAAVPLIKMQMLSSLFVVRNCFLYFRPVYQATILVTIGIIPWLMSSCSNDSDQPAAAKSPNIESAPSTVLPSSQLAFNGSVQQLRDQYEEADASSNQARKQSVEKLVITFLRKTKHRADDWVATVDSVTLEDRETIVTAKQGSATFHLALFQSSSGFAAESLSRGDQIEFSGDLGRERSITTLGAIQEPEFRFYPELLTKQNALIAKQSHKDIAKRIADIQSDADAADKRSSLQAAFSFDGANAAIRNEDSFTWKDCHAEINSHGFSYGYEAKLGDVLAGATLPLNFGDFADRDGERFSSYTHKLQTFWLNCKTPNGSASKGFQFQ